MKQQCDTATYLLEKSDNWTLSTPDAGESVAWQELSCIFLGIQKETEICRHGKSSKN